MADSMDLVQQRVEEERQRHIHTARNRTPGVSRVLCIDCDAPIPPARRRYSGRAVLRHLSGNRRAERQTLRRGTV